MKNLQQIAFILILTCFSTFSAYAQNPSQVIRGKVTDQDTESSLPGVNVQILNDVNLYTISDPNGNFAIENVPLGRVDIQFTFIGYEPKTIPNILVGSGKEIVLNVKMVEAVIKLTNATVTAEENKNATLNEMSQISARTFSVQETKRYAGAIDDPARMVSAYAGVNIDAEGNNDIIVRGNSSRGILWRLEGMEIPNPNHFAGDGSTGGPINALNSAMLDNSDFLTGAFSAEYGNATSGVFDMNLRKGNNQKHEQSASISVLGTDLTAEGPIKKGYAGSYLANYRYSTLALIDQLGIMDFGGVPKYQDASFKVSLPVGDKHVVSLFGLGGLSNISGTDNDPEDENRVIEKFSDRADLGVLGLNHVLFISKKAFLKNQLSITATENESSYSLVGDDAAFFTAGTIDMVKQTLRGASTLNYKFNTRNKFKTGVIFSNREFNFHVEEYNFQRERLETTLESDGNANTLQAFATWKFRISEKLSMVSGIHYLQFLLNDHSSIEPRWSINWNFNKNQSLFGGFGIHSRHESLSTYLASSQDENGNPIQRNKDLDLTKAAHFVAGYSRNIGSNLHFKTELYYQHLYNVPVDETWSMLNSVDFFTTRQLTNEGRGKNYGVEITLERYFNKGLYYLTTVSLYNSEYQALDKKWKDTRFNGNYVANFLIGKEFKVGKETKDKTMFVNVKTALIGGRRYTPINLEESIAEGARVNFEDQPFSKKSDDVFKLDVAFGIRRNRANISTEWKFDIQNATNNTAVVDVYYSRDSQSIKESTQLSLLPVISYRVNF